MRAGTRSTTPGAWLRSEQLRSCLLTDSYVSIIEQIVSMIRDSDTPIHLIYKKSPHQCSWKWICWSSKTCCFHATDMMKRFHQNHLLAILCPICPGLQQI